MFLNGRKALATAFILCVSAAACSPRPLAVTGPTVAPTELAIPTPTNPSSAGILQAVPAGPPAMQAGSAYRYFDGSLLDAVPNSGPVTLGGSPEEPQHQLTVSDYWIYSTEVTNQMYGRCVGLGKCSAPDPKDNPDFSNAPFANYPVVGVTWQQAADYCSFAHGQLPTEAQWEKAASWDASLSQQRLYPWGDHAPTCDLLNYRYCLGRTASVLQFGAGQSFYGAFNLAGNVAEWVADWYQAGYDGTGQDPQGPASGSARSIRGSAYDSDAMYASPSRRFFAEPTSHRPNLGFRCVVKAPAYFAAYCQMPVYYGIDPAGASANNPCPDPTIRQTQVCGLDLKVHNFIDVQTSGSTIVQVTGLESCTPGTNNTGERHECGAGVTVKVTASCGVKAGGAVTCPPNYRQDPNDPTRCVAPPSTGSCPAGFQYDTGAQCCSAAGNSELSTPLCSVGQHLYNGACVDDSTGLFQPHSLTLATSPVASCVPGLFVPNTGVTTPTATLIPFPTWTPIPPPTDTPLPTSTSQPTATPQATPTPQATGTPQATNTPGPTNTPHPGGNPHYTATPQPTNLPPTDTQAAPTATPPSTNPPQPTATEPPAANDTPTQ